ncbi:MAG: transposase [Candidatus Vogelbacteria bacterium]|nr:transposase [Candidatus Vogelbacteria bacterium]
MDIASPNTFEKLERKAKNLTPSEQLINIVAFYLMPNHFHLLLHERTEGGISKFMHRLSTAYTMFFNQKTGRTGALFEGRFKSKLIDSDAYLLKVIDYIHLNPQKIKPLNLYPWSSYADYCNKNVYEKVLNRDILREFTTVPNDHASWLATQKEISGIDHLTIDDNDR